MSVCDKVEPEVWRHVWWRCVRGVANGERGELSRECERVGEPGRRMRGVFVILGLICESSEECGCVGHGMWRLVLRE